LHPPPQLQAEPHPQLPPLQPDILISVITSKQEGKQVARLKKVECFLCALLRL